ncbi:MAG: response regulator [Syntrophomonadaceae bacterium]|nr:response regulator [Syntrophomonadaceae bacterium]
MTRVLVVNDSHFERLILKDIVSRLGYEAKTTDEYSTMNLIDSYKPNIVIANMTMNKTSGDKLIAVIKAKNPDIKCYISSCSKIKPDKLQYRGVDGCIETPITPGQLDRILQNEIRENNQADQVSENNNPSMQFGGPTIVSGEPEIIITKDEEIKADVIDVGSKPQAEAASFAFCPFCGQEMTDSTVKYIFCPFCGNKF